MSKLTFRRRPVMAAVAAVLVGLVLVGPVDARPGGGGGGGFGGGGGGGGFGGGHGGGSFGGNFGGGGFGGGGGGMPPRPGDIGGGFEPGPRPEPPMVRPPGGRPDLPPPRPGRPGRPPPPNVPWIPGAGIWWGAHLDDDDWDDLDLVYSLPNTCQQVRVSDQRYLRCPNGWYQKVFNGNQVAYVAVPAPA